MTCHASVADRRREQYIVNPLQRVERKDMVISIGTARRPAPIRLTMRTEIDYCLGILCG